MHVMTKVKFGIYAWYAVVALTIGALAGKLFQSYDYESGSYDVFHYNWKAFAIGAAVAAVLAFPMPLLAMALDRRRQERDGQRELDEARNLALEAKVEVLLGAGDEGAAESLGQATSPHGGAGTWSDDAADGDEFASVTVETATRSPYEPPPGR